MNLPSAIDAGKSIATRLTLWFVLFGALPAILIGGVFVFHKGEVDHAFREPLQTSAVALGDTIDRSFFERYGDV